MQSERKLRGESGFPRHERHIFRLCNVRQCLGGDGNGLPLRHNCHSPPVGLATLSSSPLTEPPS